jgi:hypothetical protein
MDGDPLLTGTNSAFPNQNSSAIPTEWVEDIAQAAAAGIPCATGPMLHLIQRHTNRQFLPGGAINPCRDPAGTCLIATNVNTDLAPTDPASEARLAQGLIGGQFSGGIGNFSGIGLSALGRGSNGIIGIAASTTPSNPAAAISDGNGVEGRTNSTNPDRAGVRGSGQTGVLGVGQLNGVQGTSASQVASGVYGENFSGGYGVAGRSSAPPGALGAGVLGDNTAGGWAGWFEGNVNVNGALSKSSGGFRIDHPIDPANRYLNHSFVESPDMMNVYNGNANTGAEGTVTIELPGYFEALNGDFRYQLTVMGQFAQAIVAEEISDNRFTIKTDKPDVKVSWQVTGIRRDAWAQAHRIEAEAEKPQDHRGTYLAPTEHGQLAARAIYVQGRGIDRDQVGEPPAQDPWASVPPTTWPLETARWPEHLAKVFHPDIASD